jgi:plasmid stabilization system protein ParE
MAVSNYVLYRKAGDDLERIINWYEQQSPGLSIYFLEDVEESLNKVLANPYSYKLVTTEVRRCLMKRFPYVIYYVLDRNMIVVLRVRGKRQRPLKKYK